MKLAAVLLVLGVTMLVGLVAIPAGVGESPWLAVVFHRRPLDGVLLAVGALAPIAMMGLALLTRELVRWQAAIATAGFALVLVKFRGWEQLRRFGDLAVSSQLVVATSILGVIGALIALVKAARA